MTTRFKRMPSSLRVFAKTTRLASCTFPLKSSLPTMSAAAVFGGLSSPIELGLEGTRHGLAVRTGAEELFDPSLGAVEPLLRYPRKPDALLGKRERRFDGEMPTLQLVDD